MVDAPCSLWSSECIDDLEDHSNRWACSCLKTRWTRVEKTSSEPYAATSAAGETDDDKEAPLHADLAGYWRAGGKARSRGDAAEKRAAKIARRRRRAGAKRLL